MKRYENVFQQFVFVLVGWFLGVHFDAGLECFYLHEQLRRINVCEYKIWNEGEMGSGRASVEWTHFE